jgi:hypothetical protein
MSCVKCGGEHSSLGCGTRDESESYGGGRRGAPQAGSWLSAVIQDYEMTRNILNNDSFLLGASTPIATELSRFFGENPDAFQKWREFRSGKDRL